MYISFFVLGCGSVLPKGAEGFALPPPLTTPQSALRAASSPDKGSHCTGRHAGRPLRFCFSRAVGAALCGRPSAAPKNAVILNEVKDPVNRRCCINRRNPSSLRSSECQTTGSAKIISRTDWYRADNKSLFCPAAHGACLSPRSARPAGPGSGPRPRWWRDGGR